MGALRSQLQLAPIRPRTAPALPAAVIARVPHDGGFAWSLEPYGAAGLGGVDDLARLQPGTVAGPRTQAAAVLLAHLRDAAARQDGSLSERPVLLGAACDPWQPADREVRLTRQLLEALAGLRGLDLRARTRSSLVGRDVDVLGRIARHGRVRVSVVLPGLERRTWMALEPHAPSPERRLMAVGLLSRAGIEVGVELSPVLRGVNDSDDALGRLLERAKLAGASFARMEPFELSESVRERLLAMVAEVEPARRPGLSRLLGRTHLHDPRSWAEARTRFAAACARLGLDAGAAPRPLASQLPGGAPRQLPLF